jgi:hypothetical protein
MGRRAVILWAAGASLFGLLIAAGYFVRSTSSSASSPKNAPPPTRAPRVYHEKLDGSRYVNQDLGLALSAPADWTPSLGKRSEELPPYEGLILKMESRRDPDPETQFRPLVSVFKKTLPPGPAQDPVAYIRANLISAPKKVTQAPRLEKVAGQSVGSVAYEMPASQGSLRVRQLVRIVNSEAIIVTAFIPARSYEEFSAVIDKLLGSIDWSS